MTSIKDKEKLTGILNSLFDFEITTEDPLAVESFTPKYKDSFPLLMFGLLSNYDFSGSKYLRKLFATKKMKEEEEARIRGGKNVVVVDFREKQVINPEKFNRIRNKNKNNKQKKG